MGKEAWVIGNIRQLSRWIWQSDEWDRDESLRISGGQMESGRNWDIIIDYPMYVYKYLCKL